MQNNDKNHPFTQLENGDFLFGTVTVQIMKLNLLQAKFIIMRFRKVLTFEEKILRLYFTGLLFEK